MKFSAEPDEARKIIEMACRMLQGHRRMPMRFGVGRSELEADCYVLLEDAARWFCAAVSEQRGEPVAECWSSALPQTLFEHPEVCEDILLGVEAVEGSMAADLAAVTS